MNRPCRARLHAAGTFVALAAMALPAAASAQNDPSRPTDPSTRDAGVSWRAVGISAAAVAVAFPLDGRVRRWAQDPARQNDDALRHATDVLTPLGSTVPIATGAALWLFARAFDHPTLEDEVWHSGEAVGVASVLTQVLKTVTHRPRPYVPPHDPGAFFQGPVLSVDGDRASFPSGHTTLAFAVAGAANEELRIHPFPHSGALGVALYGVATGVAFSRVYDDKHWLSDVVAGAAVGTLVSRAFVRWAHRDGGRDRSVGLLLVPGSVPVVGVRLAAPR